MAAPVDPRWWRGMVLPGCFVVLALIAGGAGIGYPLNEVALELVALALLGQAILAPARTPRHWSLFAGLAVFAAAALIGVAQLVPLPPGLWRALPGHATAAAIVAAAGEQRMWRPLSLTPDATLGDLLALLPPLAAFVAVARLSRRRRVLLLRLVVGMALLGALLAAVQVALGENDAPVLYETAHRGFGVGFFVNRNHQATLLLAAIAIAGMPGVAAWGQGATVATRGRPAHRLALFATIAFLAMGVLATSSRTALALLPVALIAASAIAVRPRRLLAWVAGAALVYVALAVLLDRTALVQQTLARFATAAEDLRVAYWANTRFAIGQALPWGTGFGSFDPVYRSVEPLSQVLPIRANHAHNDYLEVALEGGLPAIGLMAAGLFVILAMIVAAWRRHGTDRAGVLAAAVAIAMILLFSIVDFPLRMSAIGVVLGCLVGSLVPPAPPAPVAPGRARGVRVASAAIVALPLAWLSLASGLGALLPAIGQPALATRLAPWSSLGWTGLASQALAAGHPAPARLAAAHALAIAPMADEAVADLGYAALMRHDAAGDAILGAGAALGWRTTLIQAWLIQRALQTGNLTLATERIDALLRRNQMVALCQRQLRAIFVYPGGAAAILTRLKDDPPWRQGFLNAIADDAAGSPSLMQHFLTALAAARRPAIPAETALIRWRLADAGDMAAARQIWLASGGRGWLGDGGFDADTGVVPSTAAPYAWQAPPLSGVSATVAEAEAPRRGHALLLTSDGSGTGPVLAETLLLPPGAFHLSMRVGGDGARAPIGWTLRCPGAPDDGTGTPITLSPSPDRAGGTRLTGPLSVTRPCPAAMLVLSITATADAPWSATVDDVALDAIKSVP